MSEMVERVARAICLACELDCEIANASDELWENYLPDARAALNAIREPTEEMLHAGKIQVGAENSIKEIWQAMVAEALK